MAAARGTPWTEQEIEAIVGDYFDMLEIELADGGVVKAERNRILQNIIDRSRGSIEYKHQNISAVMAHLGLPFIQGYKPAVKVRWVAMEDGDGAGYDILSYSRRGEERWLEVKTTNGPATTPFWVTENERRVSEQRPDVFRLTRLYDFSRSPSAFRLKPPLTDHVRLSPTQYRATF